MEPFGKETVLLDGLRVVGEVEKLSLLLCEVISPLSSGVTLVGHARFSGSRKPVLGPKGMTSHSAPVGLGPGFQFRGEGIRLAGRTRRYGGHCLSL